jgi:N-acetyltransferase 10
VIQVCLEGEISKESVVENLQRGKRASGDLIPWTISQQFQDNDFPKLAGARVVRIATHPDYQSMGYGQRAMNLLRDYYEGKIVNVNEDEDKEIGEPLDKEKEIQVVQDEVLF